jgi:hypothetical protein
MRREHNAWGLLPAQRRRRRAPPTLRASDSLIAARRLVSCCSSTWICGAEAGQSVWAREHLLPQGRRHAERASPAAAAKAAAARRHQLAFIFSASSSAICFIMPSRFSRKSSMPARAARA